MLISLIRQPENLDSSYGGIPSIPFEPDERADFYIFDFDFFDDDDETYLDYFEIEFLAPINRLCETLLDYGDVDYIDAEHCAKLTEWIVAKLESHNLTDHERCFFETLLEYAREAVLLGTGVVVEL